MDTLFFLQNVESLTIGADLSEDILLSYSITFTQFSLTRLAFKRPNLRFSYIIHILRAQPRITELELPASTEWSGPGRLSSTDLPFLSSLTAGEEVVAWLVRGRPVQRLRVWLSRPTSNLWLALAQSTVPITHLTILGRSRADEDSTFSETLSDLGSSLRDVQFLHVTGSRVHGPVVRRYDLEDAKSGRRKLVDSLSSLQKLRKLFLQYDTIILPFSLARRSKRYKLDLELFQFWREFVEALKERCALLEEVVINTNQWTWKFDQIMAQKVPLMMYDSWN